MRASRISEEDRETIRKIWVAGAAVDVIAAQYGYEPNVLLARISYWRKREGEDRWPRRRGRTPRPVRLAKAASPARPAGRIMAPPRIDTQRSIRASFPDRDIILAKEAGGLHDRCSYTVTIHRKHPPGPPVRTPCATAQTAIVIFGQSWLNAAAACAGGGAPA